MKITDNYSITTLFITKNINIYCDNKIIKLNVPTIKDLYTNLDLNSIYHIWTSSFEDLQKLYFTPITDCFNAIETMIFEYGQYNRYRIIATKMREVLVWLIPNINIDMKSKILSVDGLTITSEIWDYILYILKLICGEKVTQPLSFDSEEARKFFMAQKEKEEKIRRLKEQKNVDKDALMKAFLSITYAFPSITIDYLCNQTMAQIQWLQKYAAGAVSYEVNAQAMAAGNMKKGKKLDFFIK